MKKLLIFGFIILFSLSSCAALGGYAANSLNTQSPQPSPTVTPAAELKEFEAANKTAKERSKLLADEIMKFDDVEHAAVVISGNTAIIGLTLKTELNDKDLIDLKRIIEKKAVSFDKGIDHVSVSAAADLYERITNINGNKPKSEEDELHDNEQNGEGRDDIFFRLTPTL